MISAYVEQIKPIPPRIIESVAWNWIWTSSRS
jgi:hypothetical protein